MKISVNSQCPCFSGKKYKKCCQPFHKGKLATSALALMQSRFCAYMLNLSEYIMITTHPNNPDFSHDKYSWSKKIESFSKNTKFIGLEIVDFKEEDNKAIVEFIARFEGSYLHEKSNFVKENKQWLYLDGLIYQ